MGVCVNIDKLASLILVGALLGAGASYIKKVTDSAYEGMESLDKSGFESCQQINETTTRFALDMELRDCEKEYLD